MRNTYRLYGNKSKIFLFLPGLLGLFIPALTKQYVAPGPEVIKRFSCSTYLSMKFILLINLKLLTIAKSFLLNIAKHEISLLINMKMPTIVGIFIFIYRENFMLSRVKYFFVCLFVFVLVFNLGARFYIIGSSAELSDKQ